MVDIYAMKGVEYLLVIVYLLLMAGTVKLLVTAGSAVGL